MSLFVSCTLCGLLCLITAMLGIGWFSKNGKPQLLGSLVNLIGCAIITIACKLLIK